MTDLYEALSADRLAHNERSDCAVVALTVASGRPYPEVWAMFAEAGRRTGGRTHRWVKEEVLERLGLTLRLESSHDHGSTVLTVEKTLDPYRTYLVQTAGHILCVKHGVAHCWTRGRRHRVKAIQEVIKL